MPAPPEHPLVPAPPECPPEGSFPWKILGGGYNSSAGWPGPEPWPRRSMTHHWPHKGNRPWPPEAPIRHGLPKPGSAMASRSPGSAMASRSPGSAMASRSPGSAMASPSPGSAMASPSPGSAMAFRIRHGCLPFIHVFLRHPGRPPPLPGFVITSRDAPSGRGRYC